MARWRGARHEYLGCSTCGNVVLGKSLAASLPYTSLAVAHWQIPSIPCASWTSRTRLPGVASVGKISHCWLDPGPRRSDPATTPPPLAPSSLGIRLSHHLNIRHQPNLLYALGIPQVPRGIACTTQQRRAGRSPLTWRALISPPGFTLPPRAWVPLNLAPDVPSHLWLSDPG